MLENSFGLFFFLKQPKNQDADARYVYLRITVDGIPKELSTKRLWEPERWNQSSGRAIGNKEDAKSLNSYLDTLCSKVYQAKIVLLDQNKAITAEALKNIITGFGNEKRMLLDVFTKHNEEINSLIGKDYAYRTYQRYRTTYDHTKAYIDWKYGKADLELKDLNYEFVKDFSIWLKTIKNCNHNSAMKYISTLGTVLKECIRKKWLHEDPFCDFSTAQEEVEIIPLYKEELAAIEKKVFQIERLELVKDIFLFSCYTGLAYVDVGNLKKTQIVSGIDNEKWIITKRQKTGTPQRIPLLAQALKIMKKYEGHKKCIDNNAVLPVLTNQKMNSYLKEIADTCGITKNLTFHIARHTFATTITLCNGVPLETVSHMLGHKRITQTQHYAKIVDLKVSEDMAALRKKLKKV